MPDTAQGRSRTPAHPVSHSSRFCGRGTTRPRWATCRSSQPVVAAVEANPGPMVSRRTHHRGPTRRWRSPTRLPGRLAGQPHVVLPGPRTPPSAPSPKVRSIPGSAMLSRTDTPPHRGRAPPLSSTKRRRCRTTDPRPRRSAADAISDAVVHEQSRSSCCRDPAQLRQRPCEPGTLIAPWRVRSQAPFRGSGRTGRVCSTGEGHPSDGT